MPQSHTPWDGVEKRRNKSTINDPIKEHFDERFDNLEALIRSGFPDGDIEGHRRAHEEVIKAAQEWKNLRHAVLEKILTTGIWSAVVLLAAILWNHFKDSLTK